MAESMPRDARVYVAGHLGMVGSAVWRALARAGFRDIIGRPRADLDLIDRRAVDVFFESERPDIVVLAAARVGGIHANDHYPAQFIHENIAIQDNVIHAAWKAGCRKLVFLGSSCIYPKDAAQPITEHALMSGPLEPTNRWYAVAKIAGLTTCQAYRRQYGFDAVCAMPTNLYGPGDNYHPENSHVVAALIRKFADACERSERDVIVWGDGTPLREFLHVDDLADAIVHIIDRYSEELPINIGSGHELTIAELAQHVAETCGFSGEVKFDTARPNGTMRKLLDSSRVRALGWSPRVPLRDGLRLALRDYLDRRHAIG